MNKKFWVGFALISLITTIVYFPSLWHLLRGETYIYFLNTQGYNSFTSLVSHFYNYEAVRVYEPGDTLLFRPLLFTVIGAEKALFGANFIGWHITSLLLNLLASFALFRLLWKIRAGIVAVLLTILFSTMYMLVNSVLYEQVAPYMLFTALMLTTLYYIDGKPLISFGCMVPACFIHEVGILFVGLMALHLWIKNRKRMGLVMSSIIPLYLAFYIPQKLFSPSPLISGDVSVLASLRNIPIGIASSVSIVETWFMQVVFPSTYALEPLSKLIYYPAQINEMGITGLSLFVRIASFGVFMAVFLPMAVSGYRKFKMRKWNGDNQFFWLVVSMFIVFVLAISCFRAGSHGSAYVVNHNFGSYIAMACVLVAVHYLSKDAKWGLKYNALMIGALVLFIGISAPKTFIFNYNMGMSQREVKAVIYDSVLDRQNDLIQVKTWKGLPSNPQYYYFTVPEILKGVR